MGLGGPFPHASLYKSDSTLMHSPKVFRNRSRVQGWDLACSVSFVLLDSEPKDETDRKREFGRLRSQLSCPLCH